MAISVEQLGPPVDTRSLMRTVRARLHELVDALADDNWHRPTVCPGWSVADIVAHVIGDDLGRLSRTHDGVVIEPEPGEALPGFLDRINEEWIVAFRRLSPAVLVSLLGAGGAEVLALWDELALDAPTSGVSWAGLEESPAWMDLARDTTEYWIHEQQIREAVDRPHHDPDEVIAVVGILSRGLPHALRDVEAEDGARVVVRADDLGVGWAVERRDGQWWWTGAAEPRGAASDAEGPAPAAVVTASGQAYWRRWTRHPAGTQDLFTVTGDPEAATAVLDHVAIIRRRD
ncbi:MAG TPA: maleylpyruvate isomerase family mycothiol-dependent enzyme [Acidimicrobiales bacterium]|jgi:uncharacterized protein (TIGR03083 family)|nr:maleylpyruvate isomerase family mycothiol-dependent enzyme [Acidimicrobiales bacterium]